MSMYTLKLVRNERNGSPEQVTKSTDLQVDESGQLQMPLTKLTYYLTILNRCAPNYYRLEVRDEQDKVCL
jgi:hypothetical protein